MERVLCLLYHRVNPINDDIYNLTVSPYNFEEQIRYLKNHYPILRFEEDWTKSGKDGIVITFDDGYGDNCEYALPILEKYHVPATIFMSTGYINGKREFWWDEIARILTMDIRYPKQFELIDSLYHYVWNTNSAEKREDMIRSLHWMLKMDPDIGRADFWLEQLKRWSGAETEGRKIHLPVSALQLRKLGQSECITIGAHTVNHRSLGMQTKEGQQYEIGTSISFLQKELNREIQVFSYPFGSAVHFNQDTFEICRQKRIIKAATTIRGLWNETTNSYRIPRMEVKNMGVKDFETFIGESWRFV